MSRRHSCIDTAAFFTNRTPGRIPRGTGRAVFAAALAILSFVPQVRAADIFWNAPAGGLVATASNWSPAILPGATDTAIFGLPIGVSDTYTATFPGVDVATDRLVVRDDDVTFDLGGATYTVDNGAIFGPSAMEIGLLAGDDASLNLTSGTLSVLEDGDIAIDPGSIGAVTVSTGATWTLGNRINVGLSGSATMTIENGGSVTSNRARIAAAGAASVGDVTVRGLGSSWTNLGNEFTVGFSGNASLTVDQQASITTSIVDIGVGSTGVGVATVDGEGSLWTMQGSLFSVGFLGSGTLNITGGGDLEHVNVSTFEVSGFIRSPAGLPPASGGMATVDGAGSTWTFADTNPLNVLAVGDKGTGTLNVTNGGLVDAPNVVVGWIFSDTDPPGVGVANISGGGELSGDFMAIGFEGGNGTLLASGGAQITSAEGGVGIFNVSFGNATLTGAGTRWDSSDALVVAALISVGTLNVENGAVVNTPWAGAGLLVGSIGNLTVTGSGSRLEVDELAMDTVDKTGRLHVGGHDIFNSSNPDIGTIPGGPGGAAVVTVENGGRAVIADMLKVWNQGTVTLSGGTVTVGTGPEETVADTLRIHSDGTLAGDGTINGNVANDGTVLPGTSTGQLDVNGTYDQTVGASLEIEIGGVTPATEFDVLTISGAANLDGALFADMQFTPAHQDSFQVMTFASHSGVFSSVTDSGLPNMLVMAPFYTATDLTLSVELLGDVNGDGDVNAADYTLWANNFGMAEPSYGDGDLNRDGEVNAADYTIWANKFGAVVMGPESSPQAVPEPSTWTLALAGILLLAVVSHRRRRR